MGDQRPKPGDKVKVTFTGEYRSNYGAGNTHCIIVKRDGLDRHFIMKSSEDLQIEVIAPEYEIGCIYQSPGGGKYVYQEGDRWRGLATGMHFPFDEIEKPLTKMKVVPEQ